METVFVQSLWSLYRDETGSEGAGTESDDDDDEEEEGTEAPTAAENGTKHASFTQSSTQNTTAALLWLNANQKAWIVFS